MTIRIHLQNPLKLSPIPTQQAIQRWVDTTLKNIPITTDENKDSLTIRFIDKNESRQLNETYRHKKGPTNVLSFPDEPTPGFTSDSLGDVAICVPVVTEEAEAQNKIIEAHYAHLIVHGVLHLLGYDHVHTDEATEMETVEIKILHLLGFDRPYDC